MTNEERRRHYAEALRTALLSAGRVVSPDTVPFEKLPQERKDRWLRLADAYIAEGFTG